MKLHYIAPKLFNLNNFSCCRGQELNSNYPQVYYTSHGPTSNIFTLHNDISFQDKLSGLRDQT